MAFALWPCLVKAALMARSRTYFFWSCGGHFCLFISFLFLFFQNNIFVLVIQIPSQYFHCLLHLKRTRVWRGGDAGNTLVRNKRFYLISNPQEK
jgi:hypothetical protein